MQLLQAGNKMVLLDEEDFERFKEHRRKLNGLNHPVGSFGLFRGQLMSRLIVTPKCAEVVDHIDGNPLNNQRSNLRCVSQGFNLQNRKPMSRSGFKGVTRIPKASKYQVTVGFQRASIYVGSFSDIKEAARAYDKRVLSLYGSDALTNQKLNLL